MQSSLSRREFIQKALATTAVLSSPISAFAQGTKQPPNVVMIFLDDSGYADFRPFGQPNYPTPHVSQLAEEGCCFTNFHMPQAICSASRASLMTGCYPGRTKVFGAYPPRPEGSTPSSRPWARCSRHAVMPQRYSASGTWAINRTHALPHADLTNPAA